MPLNAVKPGMPRKSFENSAMEAKNIYGASIRPRHKPSFSAGTGVFDFDGKRPKTNLTESDIKAPRAHSKAATPKARSGAKRFPSSGPPKHRRLYSATNQLNKSSSKKNQSGRACGPNGAWRFAHRTKKGFLPGNPEKVNQDAFIEAKLDSDTYLFAVADGHGYFGREVSSFVKAAFPKILGSLDIQNEPKTAILRTVSTVAGELMNAPFDINFSGTTFTSTLLTKSGHVLCANIGDSRVLLARELEEAHWMSMALSRDHKPCEEDEKERILNCGGRVEAYQDEEGNPMGPSRVWLLNEDIPGLAMSRSIGDLVAVSAGVTCEPEMIEQDLTPKDKFMVLGSDGIFEFLTNEEVVKIVVPFWKEWNVQGACDQLAREAHKKWITEEEVIDDITCVIVFLNR